MLVGCNKTKKIKMTWVNTLTQDLLEECTSKYMNGGVNSMSCQDSCVPGRITLKYLYGNKEDNKIEILKNVIRTRKDEETLLLLLKLV